MARIKNKHLAVLKMVLAILESHRSQLSADEKVILESYRAIIDEQEKENKTIAEQNRQRMQRYRQTPEGYDASIKASEQYRKRKKEAE